MAKILQQSIAIEKVSKYRTNKEDKMRQVVFILTYHSSTSNKEDPDKGIQYKRKFCCPVFFVLCFWLSLIALFFYLTHSQAN